MKRPAELDQPGLIPNRACRNCVQIKVKCIPLEDSTSSVCQRCHRLGKTCTTPTPVERKTKGKSTRVAQLEERMNQLSALLSPSQTTSSTNMATFGKASEASSSQSIRSESTLFESAQSATIIDNTDQSKGCAWSNGEQPIARSGSPTIFVPYLPGRKDGSQLDNELFCPVHLEADLEDRLFAEFRTKMMKEFPFVVIHPAISAQDFKEKKPFAYWACISAASHRDRMLNRVLFDEMMKAVGHRMLVAGGKSIDLLQGLLVLIGWHHYVSHYSPQFMNLLHLAQALLADLGIGKPLLMQDKIRIASDTSAMMHGTENWAVSISSDEKRALLGCFCLSSKAALTFHRIDAMTYSQHMDECCESLKNAAEYPSDALLVANVQLYQIFGKYAQHGLEATIRSSAYRKMFQDEIRHFRHSLSPALKNNDIFEVDILSGSLSFLEPAYTSENHDKMDHLSSLHTCLDVGGKLVDRILQVSVDEWPNSNFIFTMSVVHLMIVYSRLSFFKANSLDVTYAWRTVDLGTVLQQLERKFEQIHENECVTQLHRKPWRFEIYAKKAQHVRRWFDTKVAAEEAALRSTDDDVMPNTFSDNMFGSFDDSLWQDLLSNWTGF